MFDRKRFGAVGVLTTMLCAGWALLAFIYAAYAHIEGLGAWEPGVAVAGSGIGCMVLALRAWRADRNGPTLALILMCVVAFVGWLQIAVLTVP